MVPLQNTGLKTLFRPMESRLEKGEQLDESDISALIGATETKGAPGAPAADLEQVLDQFGAAMTPAAKQTLEDFLKTAKTPAPAGTFSALQLRLAAPTKADLVAPQKPPSFEALVDMHVPQVFSALPSAEIGPLLAELGHGWTIADDTLQKNFPVKDFQDSLAKASTVGGIADAEAHHPDLRVTYGGLGVELSTHDAGGLTLMDFSVAAKIERALGNESEK